MGGFLHSAQFYSESDSDDGSAVPFADSLPLVGLGDSREVEPSGFLLAPTDSQKLRATASAGSGCEDVYGNRHSLCSIDCASSNCMIDPT